VHATVLPPENWTLSNINPSARLAISPDGLRLAYTARGPDRRSMLWVRRLDALTAQPLQGTEGAAIPFWSPDSRFLGFFASGKLKKIDASGGPAVTLCDAPYAPGGVGAVPGGAWNRDGVIVFGRSGAGLQRVSASGGTPASVTTLHGHDTSHQLPFFLPDGQQFLYQVAIGSSASAGGADTEIRVGSLESSEIRPLMRGSSQAMYAAGQLLFVREQTLMVQAFDTQRLELSGEPVPLAEQIVSGPSGGGAFSVSQNGVLVYQAGPSAVSPSRLVWIDREGKELATLGDVGDYGDVQLSSDGRRAAVSLPESDKKTRDVWIFDLVRGVRTPFTFDAANEFAAIWSPDDDRVVFNSARAGHLDLYAKASTSVGDETVLLNDGRDKFPLSWSRDGRFILYNVTDDRNDDLWVLPLVGDRTPFRFAASKFSETAGQFSPDGRWIAYRSNESGRPEIWAAPFPGPGRRTQISTEGVLGGYARWRRDGKELYYLDVASRLMAVEVSSDRPELQVGTVRPLFDTRAKFQLRYPYDVSPDGQRFLINNMVGEAAPVTLVVNWPALLKK
jgi:Tol biopolymer transport system component